MTLKLKKPTLLLEGGPLEGRGFYIEDFERLLASEVRSGNRRLEHYRYERDEVHPQTGGSRGGQLSQRWVWRGPPVAEPEPPARRTACTYRGCKNIPTHELTALPDSARFPWLGCDEHAPAMKSALWFGLSGATTGTGWVEDRRL